MTPARRSWLPVFLALLCLVALYTKVLPLPSIESDARAQAANTPPPPLPSYVYDVEGVKHRLYFTFDDHPGRQTDKFLDLLKNNNLKATFFIVSYNLWIYTQTPNYKPVTKMVDSLKRAVGDGHIIGNHSATHALLCTQSPARVRWEIGKSQAWVKSVLGVDVKYWRPPHGHICQVVQATAASYGLTTAMWDVDDYRSTPSSMMRIVKQRVRRGKTETTVMFHNDPSKFETFLKLLQAASKSTP